MRLFKLYVASLLIVALSGCASIAGDNTRTVKVTSKPAGANIYVDNQRYGKTPASVTLPTYIYGGKTVTLKKAGYSDETIPVNTAFQPIAVLDILAWPTFLIDGATGSLVKIDPGTRNLDAQLTHV